MTTSCYGEEANYDTSLDFLVGEFLSIERKRTAGLVDVWAGEELSLRIVTLLRRLLNVTTVTGAPTIAPQQILDSISACTRRLNAELPDVTAAHTPLLRLLKVARESLPCAVIGTVEDALSSSADAVAVTPSGAGGLLLHARAGVQQPNPPDDHRHSASAVERDASASLKDDLVAALDELQTELETAVDNVASDAAGHIRDNDVVLSTVDTLADGQASGGSPQRLILETLRRAAVCRQFRVLLVCTSSCRGRCCRRCGDTASRLTALRSTNDVVSRLSVSVIDIATVAVVVARINRVLLPAHTVLSDGGVRAACGTRLLAAAAVRHSVPVLVLAPVYQLSPLMHGWGCRQTFAGLVSPEIVLPLGDCVSPIETNSGACVTVMAPLFDHIPAELVTLFITQTGAVSPWYVHRLLADFYDPQDVRLLHS